MPNFMDEPTSGLDPVSRDELTELLGRIRHDLLLKHGVARPDHAFLCALQACSKASLPKFFARQVAALA